MNFENIKEFMNHLTSWRMPGNTICVYHRGKEVFNYSTGYSDVENKIPMQGDEYLNIYSCSKVATVTAGLKLVEQGIIDLGDPLYEYIPEFKNMMVKNGENVTKANNPILLKHLFSMLAGLDYDTSSPVMKEGINSYKEGITTLDMARLISKKPLHFEPGSHWNYSLCHDVLEAVIEVASGEKFRDYVKNHIFEPLGIEGAEYHITSDIEKKMACQYRYVTEDDAGADIVASQICSGDKDGYWKNIGKANTMDLGVNFDSGGSGIVTPVREYAKLANGLCTGTILKSETVELLKTNTLEGEALKDLTWSQLKGYGYGLGVRTMINPDDCGGVGEVGEFGWGGAAGATLLVDTKNEICFFYAHHMQNPQEDYYQPRLRNALYACL